MALAVFAYHVCCKQNSTHGNKGNHGNVVQCFSDDHPPIISHMDIKLTIDETSTRKSLQEQVSAAFDAYKQEQARLRLYSKLERVARILQGNEQTTVECSQLFYDAARSHPNFEHTALVVNQLLASNKLIFTIDGPDMETIALTVKV